MKRLSYLIAVLALLTTAACQTTAPPTSKAQKVVASLKEVKTTNENRTTVACGQLDAAMAKGYSASRLFTDERFSNGTPSKKAKLLSLQFDVYCDDMERQYFLKNGTV